MPKPIRILAFDPGTRHLGIAVLEGPSLLYHTVKVFERRETATEILEETRRTTLQLLRDFKPQFLVVEKTFFANNRCSALVNVQSDELQQIGRRHRLTVLAFAPSTLKKRITGNGRASKEEVGNAVVARYPDLRVYQDQDQKWKTLFHANRFDAIGLALTALQEIEG